MEFKLLQRRGMFRRMLPLEGCLPDQRLLVHLNLLQPELQLLVLHVLRLRLLKPRPWAVRLLLPLLRIASGVLTGAAVLVAVSIGVLASHAP